jgi:hypothetical protein
MIATNNHITKYTKNNDNYIIYQGEMINNIYNGYGKLTTNEISYQGNFINNNFSDYGTIKYYNDDTLLKYEGDFFNNQKNGNGIQYYKDETVYIGEFKNDMREGPGKLYKNGKLLIDTNWLNDMAGKIEIKEYYDNYNMKETGIMEYNKKLGKWNYYNEDGSYKRIEFYRELADDLRYRELADDIMKNKEETSHKKGDLYKYIDIINDHIEKYRINFMFYYDILKEDEQKLCSFLSNLTKIYINKIDSKYVNTNFLTYKMNHTPEIKKDDIPEIKKLKKENVDEVKIPKIKEDTNEIDEIYKLAIFADNQKDQYIFNYNYKRKEIIYNDKPIIIIECDRIIFIEKEISETEFSAKCYGYDGKIISQGIYENGYVINLSNGKTYENGNLKREGIFYGSFYQRTFNGKLYNNNELIYEGIIISDKYEDENGTLYGNGLLNYRGGFRYGKRHGFGKSYSIYGHITYDGMWENDKKHGNGTLFDPENGSEVITGQFREDFLI